MFELMKSAASFGWAVTLFSAQQIGMLVMQPNAETMNKSTAAMKSVTGAAVSTLDSFPGSVYQAGVWIQNVLPNTESPSAEATR